ncbi:hypothetical protein IC235_21445 [Hymenobacter sp. BT664]|uniref:Uncharacterized protein n=1 Tax=Hymenobacter montanus TaxID=2771359 RepID=A0A927BIE4_9BACT|nr:hypothetical protein [Hymenobacter montanus]MBD2770458.1 hypothetical protein [Hymenobacter montanus]
MPALYLDIDGVLLTRKQQMPEGVVAFLNFALAHFDCYWLTTHCKGNAQTALRYLAATYPAAEIEKLRSVKPTDWDALKTEGIVLTNDFYWVDDYAFEAEKNILKACGKLDRLIMCDLNQVMELAKIRDFLQERLAK